jgi:hypothetical protein
VHQRQHAPEAEYGVALLAHFLLLVANDDQYLLLEETSMIPGPEYPVSIQ